MRITKLLKECNLVIDENEEAGDGEEMTEEELQAVLNK